MVFDNATWAQVQTLLTQYGLSSLADWAYDMLINSKTPDEIELELEGQQEFQTRFSGIFRRRQAGLPAMSVDEALQWEKQAASLMRLYGFPPTFYDSPDDFQDFIARDWSIVELEQVATMAAETAENQRPLLREELSRLYAGQGIEEAVDVMTTGELAAFFLDPERGLQAIQKTFTQAKLSAEARQQNFGALTSAESQSLIDANVDVDTARQRLAELQQQKQLTMALPGERDAGIDREAQLGIIAGQVESIRKLQQAQRRRTGVFGGSTQFGGTREGFALGSS
jgi:hypothetical protein